MTNGNPYYVQPANPLGGLNEAVGGYLQLEAAKKQRAQQDVKLQRVSNLMKSNDIAGLSDFMIRNPDMREHIISTQGHVNKVTHAGKVQAMKDVLLGKPVEETMKKQIDLIRSQGGDPSDAEAFLDPALTDDERKKRALAGLAIYDPQAAKAYAEVMKVEPTSKEQAETEKLKAETKLLDQEFKRLGESGILPEDKLEIEGKLRQEVFNRSKVFDAVDDAYNRIEASAKNPSAAGDMAMIFNYLKVLDPGSTVREGEYATAQQATGVPGRVLNVYNRIVDGMRLNDLQRNDFLNRSRLLYKKAKDKHIRLTDKYDRLAKKYGVDPTNVILKNETPETPETTLPNINTQGWVLSKDAQGNKAYVNPNNPNEFEEVQ